MKGLDGKTISKRPSHAVFVFEAALLFGMLVIGGVLFHGGHPIAGGAVIFAVVMITVDRFGQSDGGDDS